MVPAVTRSPVFFKQGKGMGRGDWVELAILVHGARATRLPGQSRPSKQHNRPSGHRHQLTGFTLMRAARCTRHTLAAALTDPTQHALPLARSAACTPPYLQSTANTLHTPHPTDAHHPPESLQRFSCELTVMQSCSCTTYPISRMCLRLTPTHHPNYLHSPQPTQPTHTTLPHPPTAPPNTH